MKATLEVLNSLVQGKVIDGYAIGGAVAAIFYMEPTDTGDLDIFITFPKDKIIVSLEDIHQFLRQKGYAEFYKEGVLIEGLPVQFLPASTPLLLEAYDQAISERIAGTDTRIIGFEHLSAIMLDTNRPKDKIRLSQALESAKLDINRLLEIIKRHGLEKKWDRFRSQYGESEDNLVV